MVEHAAGDASLWKVVQRGLAKNRSERWSDMTEFGGHWHFGFTNTGSKMQPRATYKKLVSGETARERTPLQFSWH